MTGIGGEENVDPAPDVRLWLATVTGDGPPRRTWVFGPYDMGGYRAFDDRGQILFLPNEVHDLVPAVVVKAVPVVQAFHGDDPARPARDDDPVHDTGAGE